jgi:hypothetical protein
MSQYYTTQYTNRDPSVSGLQKRTVNDKIRNLFPGAAQLLALVANGRINKGELTKGKGMISKTSCSTRRYEFATYTPVTIEFTVESVDGASITIAGSTAGMALKRTLVNSKNMDVGRISALTPATKVIACTAITAAFTVAAGDKLLLMAPAYEEGSSNPYRVMKDHDTNYNIMQIFRFPVAISASAKGTPYHGMKDWFGRIKQQNMVEGNRLIEHTMLFGERTTTTTTDLTTDATLGDSFGTLRGLWNWAGKSYNCGGAMSPDKFIKDIPMAISDTISSNQKVIMFCGRQIFGEVTMWANDKYMPTSKGDMEKYGVICKKIQTAGPEIELVQHDAFDRASFSNKSLIICPEDVLYVPKEGRDLKPKEGIQDNSTDGYEDEIKGEITLAELTGGLNVCTVENWFPL